MCGDMFEEEIIGRLMKEEDYELLKSVTEDDIVKTMNKMKGNSAPGLDGIPMQVWKWIKVWVIPIIAITFSSIINNP